MVPPTATARVRMDASSLELIGDEVVEQKILSSRLSLAILEKATWELNELRVRMMHLEGGVEMAPEDILRPEAVAQLLVEQWMSSGLSRAELAGCPGSDSAAHGGAFAGGVQADQRIPREERRRT